tara:strand:+ start:301 stop:618 length:318 start_codon:yes stop_codon:yes gene_type:complete
MKTTNEIQKQLEKKADSYIEEKAKEMFLIHEEIANYLGANDIKRIYYINDFGDYSRDLVANRDKYFISTSPESMKLKYQKDLAKNYKDKIVTKYTKELLAKMEIF